MASPVSEGEILAGKYRIERVLGEGGMGVVVAATHIQLDQKVAIKFLLPEALVNAEVVSRFAREARAAAKVQSEHVARVIDVATLESGSPYMVMEYLEGEDLACALERQGKLPVGESVDYLLQAAEALAEAHAVGIVHRDLKPANLFLARRADKTSIVKVLDFGISKATNAVGAMSDGVETKTSSLMGSPFYMSPEQLTAVKTVDPRSDIWALGVILYELTTGVTPFYAETMPEIVAAILSATPAPVRSLRPEIPGAVADVIERCLQRDPKARFAHVGELANALSEFSSGRSSKISAERISRVLGTEPLSSFGIAAPAASTTTATVTSPGTMAAIAPAHDSHDARDSRNSDAAPGHESGRSSDSSQLRGASPARTIGASTAASWGAGSGAHAPLGDTAAGKKKRAPMIAGIAFACVVAVGIAATLMNKSGAPASVSTAAATPLAPNAPTELSPGAAATATLEKLDTAAPVVTTVTNPALPSATTSSSANGAQANAGAGAGTGTGTGQKAPHSGTSHAGGGAASVSASAKPVASATAALPPPVPTPSATSKNPLQIQLK